MALYEAQRGLESASAKALKGFGGRDILEVVEDHDGTAWRAVYTVRFRGAIYVLHAFQKKSKTGISTPKHEVDLIRARYRAAEADYQRRQSKHER